jgi:ppGpp synthetase/RelA/SpoT-type nucleotidyltranferase
MASFFKKIRAVIVDSQQREDDGAYEHRIPAEYASKRHLYEEFGIAIYKLLDLFLQESGLRYQLAYRTNAPERLYEKLVRKAGQGVRYEHLGDIEDLAGLRVIFYSDKSKSRFLGAIKEEISGAVRFEERKTKSGYDATHIIVSFGPKRLQLSEYRHFEGLESEIQVTTILRQAWAKIKQDLIYKDINGLQKRDPLKFASMQEKLGELTETHIKLASAELEDILNEIDDYAVPGAPQRWRDPAPAKSCRVSRVLVPFSPMAVRDA